MKVHLNLATRDLDASVAFYRILSDSEPAKHYHDYALFLTEQPPLELALTPDPSAAAAPLDPYGFAVESPEIVNRKTQRFKDVGYITDVESAQMCCYAEQDKVWATDDDTACCESAETGTR